MYVLAEEGCFNGHLVGQIGVYDTGYALEYVSKFQVVVAIFAQVYHAQGKHLCLIATYADNAIAHDVSARVYAQDYLLCFGCILCHYVLGHGGYSVISPSMMRRTILFLALERTVTVLENLPGTSPLPL